MRRIEKLAQATPAATAHTLDNATELDSMTVAQWCDRHARNPRVRALVAVTTRVVFGAEPEELSALFFLAYLNAGGGLERLVEIADGAQQDRFVTGAQSVSKALAAELGEAVRLNSPVRHIAHGPTGVVVSTAQDAIAADAVIIAVPPALVNRIDFDPPLPADRDALNQRMPMGATIKFIARYERAFWREAGFSGEVVCSDGPLTVVFDNCSHGGTPALLGFLVGRHAREWGPRPFEERREAVLQSFARWFGDEALSPIQVLEKDWAQAPWTRGCPIGTAGPGVLSVHGQSLTAPIGRIHWAGTETATEWRGFMEGALQAGERAAEQALQAPKVE
jgi:monoamine oxidase